MIRRLSLALFILLFLCSSVFAEGNKVDKAIYNKISLSNKFYTNKTEALLLKTGQTTSYHADDDGDLELGIAHNFTVLTTGQYAGSTNVTINSKTHVTSNACVRDENTGDEWLREVIQADIGPATDGKLFWDQYTLAAETCTCNATNKTITADAGTPFDTGALCAGRIFTILGSAAGNNGTFTVTNITTSVITVSESVTDEASIALDFASVDDLIWDLKDQANSGSGIAGYTDWRVPNRRELESIVDMGNCNPTIDGTAFPSTPSSYHSTSSMHPCYSAYVWVVYFFHGGMSTDDKCLDKFYVRLVR
jgi:hypothetical protein